MHAQQAAGARQHQTTHSAHHAPAHPFLGSAAAGAGMMHPHMYAGTYAGPHDMVRVCLKKTIVVKESWDGRWGADSGWSGYLLIVDLSNTNM